MEFLSRVWQIRQDCLEGGLRLRCDSHRSEMTERFGYTVETAPQCEVKPWRLVRSFTRRRQHTFNCRVVCFLSNQDSVWRCICTNLVYVMASDVCEPSWSIEELIVFIRYFKTFPLNCYFLLSYLSYVCVQNKKNYRSGGGDGPKNLWPSLQGINLLAITLEYPANLFSLNHGSCPVLFIV